MNQYLNPTELAKPSGFSHAVVAAPGRTVYLAGQTAMDSDGAIVHPGDVVEQFRRCLANLLTALAAAGGGPEHVVSIRIYLTDVGEYRRRAREIGAVWKQLMGTVYPAAAGIGVAGLWDDDAMVEVEGVAVVPDSRHR